LFLQELLIAPSMLRPSHSHFLANTNNILHTTNRTNTHTNHALSLSLQSSIILTQFGWCCCCCYYFCLELVCVCVWLLLLLPSACFIIISDICMALLFFKKISN
jgi:hypothetical protein